jgi:hypothetical protein
MNTDKGLVKKDRKESIGHRLTQMNTDRTKDKLRVKING